MTNTTRTYHVTVATRGSWYDKTVGAAVEFEAHFKIARPGNIRTVRQSLAQRGIPYFQQTIYRHFHRWIPLRGIRANFEREEPATKPERNIIVNFLGMQYRGKKWKATTLPTRVISYAKRKRKRKSPK